jgi:hypothetical protein
MRATCPTNSITSIRIPCKRDLFNNLTNGRGRARLSTRDPHLRRHPHRHFRHSSPTTWISPATPTNCFGPHPGAPSDNLLPRLKLYRPKLYPPCTCVSLPVAHPFRGEAFSFFFLRGEVFPSLFFRCDAFSFFFFRADAPRPTKPTQAETPQTRPPSQTVPPQKTVAHPFRGEALSFFSSEVRLLGLRSLPKLKRLKLAHRPKLYRPKKP